MLSRSGGHVMPERQYRIHPAIGIARVGDAARSDASNDFYFIGPEIPEFAANIDPQSGVQGEFKTPDGKVKPQAARFRIFEYEKGNDGKFRPIGEVRTSDHASRKDRLDRASCQPQGELLRLPRSSRRRGQSAIRKLWNAAKPETEGP
jgi:hypothetical protein